MGPDVRAKAVDPKRIDGCRALDPLQTSRTTARDATRLLATVWSNTAASPEACGALRSVMTQQVTQRLAGALLDGGTLAVKSGAVFRRVRSEIALITDPDGETYAVAVPTRVYRPDASPVTINAAMVTGATAALGELRS